METLSKKFLQICHQAKLFEYGPTRGTIFFTPYGFSFWEKIQKKLDSQFKQLGVENVYFPSLFPYSLLEKEKEHVAGFAPEIFTIDKIGDKKLHEKLVLRPTSEVVFCSYFQKVLKSYRDLPILLNQWVNVWRYEQNPNPFLRNTEFLWNEGHTIHASYEEAIEFCYKILNIYRNFLEKTLLIPVFIGDKSKLEKFAGAQRTLTLETILPDGQFLQLATVHCFGKIFTKKFNIKFLNPNNKWTIPNQTSWGLSTRAIAGLLQTHYDDQGLVLPFAMAKYQIVILPIHNKEQVLNVKINSYCELIKKKLQALDLELQFYVPKITKKNFSYHCYQAELLGIPIRLEIGAQELEEKKITFVSRSDLKKQKLSLSEFLSNFKTIINMVNKELYSRAVINQINKIKKITDFQLYCNEKKDKAFQVWFCNEPSCETTIKKLTATVSRALWQDRENGICFKCSKKTNIKAFFGRSY